MNHTPGPWRYSTEPQPNGCPIIGAGPLMVAMLAHTVNDPTQRETATANARLIAAAPDMLEALQRLEQYGHTQATWEFALRAVAKAVGK